jgi:hypothetical protein
VSILQFCYLIICLCFYRSANAEAATFYKSYPTYGHIWKMSADAEPEAKAESDPTFYKYGAPSYYQRSYNPSYAMMNYGYGMPMSGYRSYPGYGMPGYRSYPSNGMSHSRNYPTYGHIWKRSGDADAGIETKDIRTSYGDNDPSNADIVYNPDMDLSNGYDMPEYGYGSNNKITSILWGRYPDPCRHCG